MPVSLAIDIGGTFTDIILSDPTGRLAVEKTLTTHHDLLEGLFDGTTRLLGKVGRTYADIDGVFVHATTVVTNALIERKGSATALVVTKGFRDVLTIRNEHRYDMYDPLIENPDPLIPLALTFELDERVHADGTVGRTPGAEDFERVARALADSGVQSVAVCLLNAYVNPAHERALAAHLATRLPGLLVSLSSAIAPQIREYPRASTTAVNAYTQPITVPYLGALADGIRAKGMSHQPLIMLSSGGTIGADIAARHPVRMIESGPAAGALAAAYFARTYGLDRLMSFDMGGTTAKACLIEDRAPRVTGTFEVDRKYRFLEGSGMPIIVPSIDMIEIGAGGGSIAHVDALGLLKVGPESAGSNPGPACYGRGGANPTVTDADLFLNLLDAENFLGGDMRLDRGAAEAAIGGLAARLGTQSDQAASGIYRIVAETMAAAARTHAADRGVDYRGLPMLAFGGAGPVHACAVAELIQSSAVYFPLNASVLSAFGTLVTPVRLDLVRSAIGRLSDLDWAGVDHLLGEMVAEGLDALRQAGEDGAKALIQFGADLRYVGQQNEVTVNFDADPRSTRSPAAISGPFEAAYQALYGITPSHVPIELITWRVSVRAGEPSVRLPPFQAAGDGAARGARIVPLWSASDPVPVYARANLMAGQRIAGPAIIEERETTIVLPPAWTGTLDPHGTIIARPEV